MRTTKDGFIVKGIIHCHTDLSYDSQVNLADLCAVVRQEGFDFVALTEHSQGVNADVYNRFITACRRKSDDMFVVIPGLEIRCSEGIEIAGIGVSKIVKAGSRSNVIAQIRKLNGYAILVHPSKQGKWDGQFLNCDAIEVLNGKIDGTIAPKISLLRKLRKHNHGYEFKHLIFGLDLHNLQEPRNVWIECEVSTVTADSIIESLRTGRFVNRVAHGSVGCFCHDITLRDLSRFVMLRSAYMLWNIFLKVLPASIRHFVILVSRPLVKTIKEKK